MYNNGIITFKEKIKTKSNPERTGNTDDSYSINDTRKDGTDNHSWARDNTVTKTRPCVQATKLFVIARLLYLVWLLHLDTEI